MQRDNEKYNMNVKENSDFINQLKEKLPDFFDDEETFNIGKFMQEIKENNVNEINEGYQLDFVGKDYARRQVGELPTSVIVPDEIQNEGKGKNSQNLFFSGDNLEALRHLQGAYSDKIDVIYIDPPYNTGNGDFVYSDKFEYSDNQLQEMFGLNDEGVTRLKSIQGKSSHSAWLTFMYPRLALAKNLLSSEGVIFVSIDENELANLTLLMNSIFGEAQFKVQFVWTKTSTPPSLSNSSRRTTEYVLAFEKQSFHEKYYGSDLDNADTPMINSSNSESEVVLPIGSCVFYKYENEVIDPQKFDKVETLSQITVKNFKNVSDVHIRGHLRWSQEKINEEVEQGTIFLFKSRKLNPRFQRKDTSGSYRTPNTNLNKELGVLTNEMGVKRLEELGMGKLFTNPKPVSLIKYLINITTHIKKDATVLDFFAGSATTADAVMQLNVEDGGSRKFIMVQLPEKTYTDNSGIEVPKKGAKYAFDSGYKTIDMISRQRISRAAEKIKEDNKLTLPDGFDGNFKHYRIVEPTKQAVERLDEFDPDNTDLFNDMLESFSSQGLEIEGNSQGESTILSTWLVADGYPFSEKIKPIDFEGYIAHIVGNNRLYVIKSGWGKNQTKRLINQIGTHQLNIQTVIVFGYSFGLAEIRELENGLNQLNDRVNLIRRY